MKRIIILFLLVIAGCAETGIEVTTPIENVQELSVEINPNITQGEVPLEINSECQAEGGEGNYSYDWMINDESLECNSSECQVTIDEPGNHTVLCSAFSGNQTEEASINVEALKQRKQVDLIITLGDSLTYGHGLNDTNNSWPNIYAEGFADAEVINTAQSGATTYSVIRDQMPRVPKNEDYKIIFLWIGANDARRLFEPDVFRENYQGIAENLTKIPNSRVYLMNIPDATKLEISDEIDAAINEFIEGLGLNVRIDTQMTARSVILTYNEIIQEISEQHNLTVIDMYSYLEEYNETLISEDRVHPSVEGHKIIEEKIEQEVNKNQNIVLI